MIETHGTQLTEHIRLEESNMKQFKYTLTDPLGIHARPAGLLAKEAKSFADTTITVTKGTAVAKATQLMKLMSLSAKQGDVVTVTAEGANEEAAIAGMIAFFEKYL